MKKFLLLGIIGFFIGVVFLSIVSNPVTRISSVLNPVTEDSSVLNPVTKGSSLPGENILRMRLYFFAFLFTFFSVLIDEFAQLRKKKKIVKVLAGQATIITFFFLGCTVYFHFVMVVPRDIYHLSDITRIFLLLFVSSLSGILLSRFIASVFFENDAASVGQSVESGKR